MNTNKMRKLVDSLQNTKYTIKSEAGIHRVYFKRVIVAECPEESIADYIAKEHGALNLRIANSIHNMIERTEANVKQEVLNLTTGEDNGTDPNN